MCNRYRVSAKQIEIAQRYGIGPADLMPEPERLWGKDDNYEALKELKRQGDPPDPRREIADYIVSRLEEAGWEVSYPAPEAPASPPPYQSTSAKA